MKTTEYVPQRGDLVWLDFNPQQGHEQYGRRPALIISPGRYNSKTGLALCCPITSKQKGYPFEVVLPDSFPVTGVILSDHVKNLDWKIRNAAYISAVTIEVLNEVLGKLGTLL